MTPRRLLAAVAGFVALATWLRRSDRMAYRLDSIDQRISAVIDDIDSFDARLIAVEQRPFIGQVPYVAPQPYVSPWYFHEIPGGPVTWDGATDGTSTEVAKRGVGSVTDDAVQFAFDRLAHAVSTA